MNAQRNFHSRRQRRQRFLGNRCPRNRSTASRTAIGVVLSVVGAWVMISRSKPRRPLARRRLHHLPGQPDRPLYDVDLVAHIPIAAAAIVLSGTRSGHDLLAHRRIVHTVFPRLLANRALVGLVGFDLDRRAIRLSFQSRVRPSHRGRFDVAVPRAGRCPCCRSPRSSACCRSAHCGG